MVQSEPKLVLLVNPNVSELSNLQDAFAAAKARCVVARDLPTALLAITQHRFQLALVSQRIAEEGDGWALCGVLRLVFPKAFIAVLTRENSVPVFQSAINNGLNQVYDPQTPPTELVDKALREAAADARKPFAKSSIH